MTRINREKVHECTSEFTKNHDGPLRKAANYDKLRYSIKKISRNTAKFRDDLCKLLKYAKIRVKPGEIVITMIRDHRDFSRYFVDFYYIIIE